MKRMIVSVASTVLALAFFVSGTSQPQNVSANAGAGQEVYQKSCLACHGADGNSGRARDLVTDAFKEKYKDFEQLEADIKQSMPKNAPGSLTDLEYQQVTEYLWKLNGKAMVSSKISVFVNQKELAFPVAPVLNNGTTLVPLREIFEALGADVKWDEATKTVTAVKGTTTIKLTIGRTEATVGSQKVVLSQAAQIIESKTFVSLRFVSEALGAKVEWDGNAKVVTIAK